MVTEVWKQKVETVPLCCHLPRYGHKSRTYLCHVSTSVAVVRCSFQINLSLQIMNVACSGHLHSSWNKCHMPNNSPASGCFAKWSHSYGKISYSISIRASQKFPLSFCHCSL